MPVLAAPQPYGSKHNQGNTNEQEDDSADQQPNEDGPQQVGAGSGLHIHGHRSTGIGVHDHHSPAAGPQVPFELLLAGAGGRGGPEALVCRPRGDVDSSHIPVLHPERVEADFGDLRMADTLQVGRHVVPRSHPDEDFLAGNRRTAQHDTSDHADRSGVRHAALGHDVEAGCRQGVGVREVTFGWGGEVPVVSLQIVGEARGPGARQQPQSEECAERTQHQHDNPACSHGRHPFNDSDQLTQLESEVSRVCAQTSAFSISPSRRGPSLPFT